MQTSTAEESAEIIFKILSGKTADDAKAEIVLVNSAAGIIVGGKAENFKEGMEMARESIREWSCLRQAKGFGKSFRQETCRSLRSWKRNMSDFLDTLAMDATKTIDSGYYQTSMTTNAAKD